MINESDKKHNQRVEESLGFLFWQTNNMWERKINCELKKINLTHVQFVLLAGVEWFNHSEDIINQAKLSRHVKTNIMMTSKVLRTLEKKGLITRKPDKVDTRQNHLFITDKGKEKLNKGFPIVRKATEDFFSPIKGKKGELLDILNRTLKGNTKKEKSFETEE
jgi:DNA-binding MarR family transcriptional regulator